MFEVQGALVLEEKVRERSMEVAQDEVTIEILDSGLIKVTTDRISAPNHAAAEEFLRLMAELSNGGKQDRRRKAHAHHHSHGHDHVHGGH
jgi:hypothetical protein